MKQTLTVLVAFLAGCSTTGDESPGGDPDFVASCSYTSRFTRQLECREYRGAGWSLSTAAAACDELAHLGEKTFDGAGPCELEMEVGRCAVGDLAADGYTIVLWGDSSDCGFARTGCETFARGVFEETVVCDGCIAAEESGPVAIVPEEPDCRAPLPGEPPGASSGLVCTPVSIAGSTEPGRRYADYADCEIVRTQRPYYEKDVPFETAPDDPRLSDESYMADVEWLRGQAEASACSCCHTASVTPRGAAEWDTEASPIWLDSVTNSALAMFAGITDSSGLGFFAVDDNNGFSRIDTGLPTTDVARLRAFAERELDRRGVSLAEAEQFPPFAPVFRELIDYVPEPCADGLGVDAEGVLQWTGGGARYIWVLEADARSPGLYPSWDLPEGTLWALRSEYDGPPMSCTMRYGEIPPNAIQRVPVAGAAPPALTSGESYYLVAMRDTAQPITRCLFTAP